MADNTYSSRVHCHVSSFLHFRINEENDSLRGFCFHLSIFIFLYSALFPTFFSFLGVYSIYFSFLVFYSSFFSFLVAYISLLPFSRFLSLIFLFFLSPICRLHFIYLHHLPLSFPEPFSAHPTRVQFLKTTTVSCRFSHPSNLT